MTLPIARLPDVAASAPSPTAAALGDLPVWNLADLYASPDDPVLARDLDAVEAACKAFAQKYKALLAGLSGAELAAAIQEYERIDEILSRVMSYAGLLHAGDLTDPKIGAFQQKMSERVTAIAAHTVFFQLELNALDDAVLAAQLKAPALAHYKSWIDASRAYKPHQLTEEMERLLLDRSVVGRSAWTRLFEETIANMRFPVEGKELTSPEALHLLSGADGRLRKLAAESIGATFASNIRLFTQVTNVLAKDKEIDDRWRNFSRATSARNLANRVEDEVVDALVDAVKRAYPRLSHRYYKLKAKWFGSERLDYWDRNAPLPESIDRTIPWDEARETVLSAYAAFSPDMAAVGRRFFDKPWIDAPARPGKSPGAFAHPTIPSVHPYLLLNYQGKVRDVMTLAHELGHGVHQVLAGAQGHFLADTPLTLAETASVFGEMLTFRKLLDAETDPARRRIMLAGKVEDMLNTVVRQISMFDFERRVHAARREGELTAEMIGEHWLATQTESLGPTLRFDANYKNFWAYIPHFVHTPFYVYAYAFGDCLVNSLYAVYQAGDPRFAEKYLDMLRAGGTKRHQDLLAPFGLDASDPAFWDKGLSIVAGFIDELETVA